MEKKGYLITLEGTEGVGKSTHLTLIKNYLEARHISVLVTREPGGTRIAEKIRDIALHTKDEILLPETELLLMFAARNQHVQQVVLPALERGEWVISDRFIDASYAYQGGGRGILFSRIALLEQWVLQGLRPQLTFLFDAPVSLGLSRASKRTSSVDRIEAETHDFFERVRLAYLMRAEKEPERFRLIDASLSLGEVSVEVTRCLDHFFQYAKI